MCSLSRLVARTKDTLCMLSVEPTKYNRKKRVVFKCKALYALLYIAYLCLAWMLT